MEAADIKKMKDLEDENRRLKQIPDAFNRYHGPELVSLALAQWAEEHGVMLEFIKPGKPTQNAFIERFNRTYRTEILDFYLFRTLNEVRGITERWLTEYNSERPHESLNNLTPEEYRLMAETPDISKNAWN